MFPLKKTIIKINNTINQFIDDYSNESHIPIGDNVGAFGVQRKNHIHEGVDLYCNEKDMVFAIESGVVVSKGQFTGKEVGSAWWNYTEYVMIESESGVINYGEIIVSNLSIGDKIPQGQHMGYVTTVLKKNKGRPMTMLHLELYEHKTEVPIGTWNLNTECPSHLKNPTSLLLKYVNQKD